jgi:hypothetical protein
LAERLIPEFSQHGRTRDLWPKRQTEEGLAGIRFHVPACGSD